MNNKYNIASDVPEQLLKGKTDDEKWMYNQQSIQRQLSEKIISRLDDGDKRFDQADIERGELKRQITTFAATCEAETRKLSQRIEPFEKIRNFFAKKWKILVTAIGGLLASVVALVIGEAVWEWVKHVLHIGAA